jgi:acetylornithine/succinyldiaminopimelate/putrescine aminotransferase
VFFPILSLAGSQSDPYEWQECLELLDRADMLRDWGTRLLAHNDPAFTDPEYLKEIQGTIRPGAVGMDSRWRGTHDTRIDKFTMQMQVLQSAHVIRFANSGTDANNVLFEFAEHAYRKRTGKNAKRINLLYFQDPYGGVHGRISEISIRYDKDSEISKKFEIPTPHLKAFKALGSEVAFIEKKENEALNFIRNRINNTRLEIGGIFIEPISASHGVWMYRPEFMKRLRALADELEVPIFADEVLTGGGRTGKFWAYEHYPGFEPDLITFGKGMGVSGVAAITRYDIEKQTLWNNAERWKFEYSGRGQSGRIYDNTSLANPLALVQSGQVLSRIHSGRLVENAESIGSYLIQRIKLKAERVGLPTSQIRGVGMLIDLGRELATSQQQAKIFSRPIKSYVGRLTPVLTLSKQEVDELIPF